MPLTRDRPSSDKGTSGMGARPMPRKVFSPTVQRSSPPSMGHETYLHPTGSEFSARLEERNRERTVKLK